MSGICDCRRFLILLAVVLTLIFMYKVFLPGAPNSLQFDEDGLPTSSKDKVLNLTESEQIAFDEFKERVKTKIINEPNLKPDVFLIKWLQVADFNVEKADTLLTENLEWKIKENISTIHEEDWSDLKAEYECNLNQVDFKGRPVAYINLGAWNIRKAINSGNQERLGRYVIKMLDEAVNLVYEKYKVNNEITQFWILIELDGYSYYRAACFQCISSFTHLATIFEEKYPRMGKQIISINTPGIFSIVFNLIRPIFSETTQENVHLLGGREEWEPILSKFGVKENNKIQSVEQS